MKKLNKKSIFALFIGLPILFVALIIGAVWLADVFILPQLLLVIAGAAASVWFYVYDLRLPTLLDEQTEDNGLDGQEENDTPDDSTMLREEVQHLVKSLFVTRNNRFYQIIRQDNRLYFRHISSFSFKPTIKIITDFSDDADFTDNKHDFSLALEEIEQITLKYKQSSDGTIISVSDNGVSNVRLAIKTAEKTVGYRLVTEFEPFDDTPIAASELCAFFDGMKLVTRTKQVNDNQLSLDERQQQKIERLRSITRYFSMLAPLLVCIYFALGTRLRFLTIIMLLVCAVFFLTLLRYHSVLTDELTLPRGHRQSQYRIMPFIPLALACAGILAVQLIINLLISFTALLVMAVAAAVLVLITLLLVKNSGFGMKLVFVAAAISVGFSAVLAVNYGFDYAPPVEVQARVVAREEYSDENDQPLIDLTVNVDGVNTVITDDGSMNFGNKRVGNFVLLTKHNGALGIGYYDVK